MKAELIVVGFVCLVLVSAGCVINSTDENKIGIGERKFIEAQLSITNAEASNYYGYPSKFGLLKDRQYTLEFTAEKFMAAEDGEMEMNISLTEEFQIIDGDFVWSGTDKRKTIQVIIKPIKNGDYLISASAKNLDFLTDPAISNGWSSIFKVSIFVRDTSSEAKEAVKPPKGNESSPVEILREVKR